MVRWKCCMIDQLTKETCLFLIPRAGQVHNSRIEQAGSICNMKGKKNNVISEITFKITNLDMSAQANSWAIQQNRQQKFTEPGKIKGPGRLLFFFIIPPYYNHIVVHIVSTLTKVICGGVKVLFWWGAGEGQAPAQAAVMHQHIQEDVLRQHLHYAVQRPNCQVGTILQRFSSSDNNKQAKVKCRVTVNQAIIIK